MTSGWRVCEQLVVGLLVLLAAITVVTATALAQADMRMGTISISDTVVFTNQNYNYTFRIHNYGPQNTTGVVVTVDLPDNVTYISASGSNWSCSGSDPVTCSRSGMSVWWAEFVITVQAPATYGTIQGVSASVTSALPDPDSSNNSNANNTVVTVTDDADMTVSLHSISDTLVFTNQNYNYTFVFGNSGPQEAPGAVITVDLPDNVTFVSASGGYSCSGTDPVTCTKSGTVVIGWGYQLVITVQAPATYGTVQGVLASVTSTLPDPNPSNNTYTNTTVVTVTDDADMRLMNITFSDTLVFTNENYNYNIIYGNNGPQEASGAVLTVDLPDDVTFVSASTGFSCSGADPVTCSKSGRVATGYGYTLTIVVRAPATYATIQGVSASVSSTLPDPALYNNTYTNNTTVVTVTDDADLSMYAIGINDTSVYPGQNYNYTFRAYNHGPQPTGGVVITADLPAGVTFVSASGTNWSCSGADPVTCSYSSSLGVGVGTSTITVTVQATATCGPHYASASVTATQPDPNLSNNSRASAAVNVSPCDSTAPIVNVNFAPDGQNDWFVSSPATGTVTAVDAYPSNITAINCTGASVSGLTGIGTGSASATVTVLDEGITAVSCTASDAALNTGAAAGSSNTASVKIDTVAPEVSVLPDRASDQNGFYNQAIGFAFSGNDATSGIASCSAPVTYSGPDDAAALVEGTCSDNAGNIGSNSLGFSFDASEPVITGSRTPVANANGWNNTDVTVSFECTDALSGVDSLTSDTRLSSDGADQFVTGICTDQAGNSASATVGDINIDKTAPVVIGARAPEANANGWNNTDVIISFTCDDVLSGVGNLSPGTILSSEEASQSVTGTCVDKAGNFASAQVDNINIDKTGPAIVGSRIPEANVNGWNNTDVTVSFSCEDAVSGVDTVTPDVTFSNDGAGQSVEGVCMDLAGNVANTIVSDINIDKTASVITGSRTPEANANGWDNTDVIISFTCDDVLSGVDSLTPDVTLSSEGAGHSMTGTCTDQAGNSASTTVDDINIDKTAPTIAIASPLDNGTYSLQEVVIAAYSCSDALSGTDTCAGPVADGGLVDTTLAGLNTFAVASADLAGNTVSLTHTYTVQAQAFFLRMVSALPSVAKAGSTIPLRWQYVDQAGNVVDSASINPEVLISSGSCSSEAEAPLITADDAGNSGLRYDADSKTWNFNIKIEKGTTGGLSIWIVTQETGQTDYVGCVAIKP